MKFLGENGYEASFAQELSMCNKDVSPIKEILERKDFSKYSFSDVIEIPLSETTPIQVNIIDVGQCIFFFATNNFDKDSFVQEVSKLKEMPVSSFYDVLTKVRALDEVTFGFNPLFVVYNPIGKFRIFEDCYRTLHLKNKTIYISLTEDQSEVVKGIIPDKKPEKKTVQIQSYETAEKPKQTNETGFFNKVKSKLFNPIKVVKTDKFHFLFALIATFLIGFTLSIGIYNAYAGKLICIFFFICCLAGMFLDYMIYKDAFKDHELSSPFAITTILSSLIGLGLSIGGYFIFKLTSKEELAKQPHFIMILGLMIVAYLLASSIPYLIEFLKKRKK